MQTIRLDEHKASIIAWRLEGLAWEEIAALLNVSMPVFYRERDRLGIRDRIGRAALRRRRMEAQHRRPLDDVMAELHVRCGNWYAVADWLDVSYPTLVADRRELGMEVAG